MSSKIDCRECMGTGGIERLSNCKHCAGTGKIAAPVVERQQPFAWFTDDYLTDKSSTTYDELTSNRWKTKGWSVQPLFTAAPELAELQATIAQLTAEVKDLLNTSVKEEVFDIACKERDQLKAEIERLKGGQGEPVAIVEWSNNKPDWSLTMLVEIACPPRTPIKLYTSQPAPVSSELVQLLERAKIYARGPFLDEINACLDKVKELTYQGHASDCSTNNRGVPELLGPCDCELSRKPQ